MKKDIFRNTKKSIIENWKIFKSMVLIMMWDLANAIEEDYEKRKDSHGIQGNKSCSG